MSKTLGRWAFTERASEAHEMVHEESDGAVLVGSVKGIRRIPHGRGWKIWEDGGGYTNLTEYTAEECDAFERDAANAKAAERSEEDRLREESRAAREMAPASIRAPR